MKTILFKHQDKKNTYFLIFTPHNYLFGCETLAQEFTMRVFYFWPFSLMILANEYAGEIDCG